MRIIVQIRGNPRSQQRHRHNKQGKFVITYDPSSKDKDDFLAQIISKAPKEPFDEPLRVDLYFYMNRPKSHFGTGKNHGTLKKSAPRWHTSVPDADNLAKLVLDSMNKSFWRDDSIICYSRIVKQYSKTPFIKIVISSIDEPTPDVYLRYFGLKMLEHVSRVNMDRVCTDKSLLSLIDQFIQVSVTDRGKLDDMGVLNAISWLEENYRLKD